MKNRLRIWLAALLLSFTITSKGQDTAYFENMNALLDKVTHVFKDNHPELTFFKYHLISTDGNIYDHYDNNNGVTDSIFNVLTYIGLVKDAQLSNFNSSDSSVELKKLLKNTIAYISDGFTPLSLTFIEYSDFKDSTIFENLIGFENNEFTEQIIDGYYPFIKKRIFAASAMNHVIKTPTIKFILDENFIQSNVGSTINNVYIDFDDSNGFIEIEKGRIYEIIYGQQGVKNCKVKILTGTDYFTSTFQIIDSTSLVNTNSRINGNNSTQSACDNSNPVEVDEMRNISTSFNGNSIDGRYGIWYANCNVEKKIKKPYIISVGVNPGHGKQIIPFQIYNNDITIAVGGTYISIPVTFGWRGTYYETYNGGYSKRFSPDEAEDCGEGTSNGTKFLDRIREEGYDVIILMYDEGLDYVENNAALIMKLVKDVNAEKFANGSYFENIVAGYSAGALSTRLALAQMEQQYKMGIAPHPHTKMWVAVESENQGANVPLGFQYLLDFQANGTNSLPSLWGLNIFQQLADNINVLSATVAQGFNVNPIANELTLYTTASPNGPSPDRIALMNRFATLAGNSSNGYPEFVRRVGVSQGSSVAQNTPHTSPIVFDSQLKMNPFGDSYTESDCQGTYTVYKPVAIKTTTAKWWSANNSGNIFDARVAINSNWTFARRICVSKVILGHLFCGCIGPFTWTGVNGVIADKHIAKPTVENNFDDVPASTMTAHIELYSTSAYPFYNSWFAGNSHANADSKLHGFAPTVSCLDLMDPATGLPVSNYTSPASLGLMKINDIDFHPDSRYGFPYISHPVDHYKITPFDAVFAIGINNGFYSDGTTPKPDNQLHVEDPQKFIGDYLARVEVAPENLFMSNQTVGESAALFAGYSGGYKAEFDARTRIITGKTDASGTQNVYALYNNENYLTPNGNFEVAIGSKAILHAGETIEMLPGTEIKSGAELAAFTTPMACPNSMYRASNNTNTNPRGYNNIWATNNVKEEKSEYELDTRNKQNGLHLFPNPNNGIFTVINYDTDTESIVTISDVSGKEIIKTSIINNSGNELNLQHLANGIYLLLVKNANGTEKFKLVISK